MNTRIGWIDLAKGVGIILVVFGHVIVGMRAAGLGSENTWMVLAQKVVYSFHMPLFFFLAGLNVEHSLRKRGAKGFFIEKALTIGYPYVVWSVITGTMQSLGKGYVNSQITNSDILAIIWRPLPNQHY